jgi:biopolymer transport protein ExbB
MPVIEIVSSWTRRMRYVALLLTGVGVAFIYALYQPALAQDNARPGQAGPSAAPVAPAKTSGETVLSKEEIDKKLDADMQQSAAEKPDKKEAIAAAGSGAATLDIIKDIHWLSPHMWAVYAIAGVSLISLFFAAERALALRRSKVLPYDLAAGIRAIAARKGDFDLAHAQRLCRQYPSSAASVFKAMLDKAGRPVPEIEAALTAASESEASRLFSNVRWQNLAFNVAPMLGLAGTVHGMIIAFYVTAHMPLGKNKMESLATGIYAALVCTFAGLIVAIPAGVFSHYFEGRILKLFQQIEDLARSIMPQLGRLEGRISYTQPTVSARNQLAAEDEAEPSQIIAPQKK